MRRTIWLLAVWLTAQTAWAADAQAPASQASEGGRRPTRIWQRTGPLGETPQRISDAFPLSDQQNRGGWMKFEPMSDEFEGKELDPKKWELGIGGWKGRPPAMFSDKNVTVADGKLHLAARKEKLPPEEEKQGYRDLTSAAARTKASTLYGYYEVKARPMNSALSSAFFFIADTPAGLRSEIDVFEIGGNAKGFEKYYVDAVPSAQVSRSTPLHPCHPSSGSGEAAFRVPLRALIRACVSAVGDRSIRSGRHDGACLLLWEAWRGQSTRCSSPVRTASNPGMPARAWR